MPCVRGPRPLLGWLASLARRGRKLLLTLSSAGRHAGLQFRELLFDLIVFLKVRDLIGQGPLA